MIYLVGMLHGDDWSISQQENHTNICLLFLPYGGGGFSLLARCFCCTFRQSALPVLNMFFSAWESEKPTRSPCVISAVWCSSWKPTITSHVLYISLRNQNKCCRQFFLAALTPEVRGPGADSTRLQSNTGGSGSIHLNLSFLGLKKLIIITNKPFWLYRLCELLWIHA